eukprot:2232406-Pleurochrysis_carterae.AAC.1
MSPCASGYQLFKQRTNRTKMHRNLNGNAKTFKCACSATSLGIYNLKLTHVAVECSVDRAPAEN